MKFFLVLAISLVSIVEVSLAEMKIPRSIHRMDELDEAIVKAIKKEKPLVFVYTDPGTS